MAAWRLPVIPLGALFAGSAIVLGLFLMRGFNLREHARIMIGALVVFWIMGALWTLATAAENAGGVRRLGAVNALLVLATTLAAAFAPVLLLWLVSGAR